MCTELRLLSTGKMHKIMYVFWEQSPPRILDKTKEKEAAAPQPSQSFSQSVWLQLSKKINIQCHQFINRNAREKSNGKRKKKCLVSLKGFRWNSWERPAEKTQEAGLTKRKIRECAHQQTRRIKGLEFYWGITIRP